MEERNIGEPLVCGPYLLALVTRTLVDVIWNGSAALDPSAKRCQTLETNLPEAWRANQ